MRIENMTESRNESIDTLSGAEHFLVGISPQYWSHTPMTIKSLNGLGLVDGIDCIVIENETRNGSSREVTGGNRADDTQSKCQRARIGERVSSPVAERKKDARFIPVSKCELQGVIVNVERKSNGSCIYLLDDGTGVVDCVYWADSAMYSLPSLLPHDEEKGAFLVGDMVRVFGKIKCVSIGGVCSSITVHDRDWKVQDCVREVHIASMSSLPLNSQTNHWLRCLQFARRASIHETRADITKFPTITEDSDQLNFAEKKEMMTDPVRNGPDVLCLIGPEIASKAVERSDLPAPNDTYGAWRVFGVGCRCELSYLESLLYCHCQATVVSLDPHFKFRDAVLELLLRMESAENSQLRFQYKVIVRNASLQMAAAQAVVNERNTAMSSDRLFMQTFAALRNDGIVSLLDNETDTYLLVSRAHVLEPHCKKLMHMSDLSLLERRVLQSEQPAYLKRGTCSRLQYVKKTLMKNH